MDVFNEKKNQNPKDNTRNSKLIHKLSSFLYITSVKILKCLLFLYKQEVMIVQTLIKQGSILKIRDFLHCLYWSAVTNYETAKCQMANEQV